MKQLALILIATMGLSSAGHAQSVLAEQVPPPFTLPAGEGLFRLASAEPLGQGGFQIRLLNEAYQISVDKVGEGTSVTGHLAAAFGLANTLDIAVSMPLMFDIAGGLTKYGTGDVTTSLKLGIPGRFPASFYGGIEFSATHPFGFKGDQPLEVRLFSRGDREMATRLLFDVNREAIGIRLNAGYLIQSGVRDPGLILGGGVEVGRGQIFTMTAEYMSEPSILGARTERAVFGVRMNLWWLQVEAGIEQGFSKDLPEFSGMGGIRLATSFGSKRRKSFGNRTRRVPVEKDISTGIRVAVVNLQGFETRGAGEAVARQIKTALTRHGHVRLVDVGEGTAFLDADGAVSLAEQASADVVITGRVLQYELTRNSRPNLPLVVGFPETAARVNADLRIVDARQNGDLFSTNLSGVGRKSRGVRMFPVSGDDRTSYLTEVEKNKVWDDAINQVVVSLLRQLSENFKWFPG
ncbi:TPA: hypothetical protein DCE37_23255 [Candidatus Latescibacteria bacterium]|nr:hypothetical protein [Candidatus Latescibacterota bacterium]